MAETPRLKIPKEAKKGETIEIKTLDAAHHGVGSAQG